MPGSGFSQLTLQKQGTGDGVRTIRRDRPESQGAVERDCFAHRRKSVEAHPRIAFLAGRLDHRQGQTPSQTDTTVARPHVEALHLTGRAVELAQRHAASHALRVSGQQQHACGRGVVARQPRQLGVEILEREIDAERVRVFAEKGTDEREIFGKAGGSDGERHDPKGIIRFMSQERSTSDAAARFGAFVDLIARLRAPGGCPWDREQTHETVKPMTIEEAYEVAEAIDGKNDEHLRGELGDLLLQVVFHAQIAADRGAFTIRGVIDGVSQKMVRRHPHVFADDPASTPSEVLRNWEALKEAERAAKGRDDASMLDSVSAGLPAVMEAFQMATKVSRVGFDWPDAASVIEKLDEEVAELKEAVARSPRDRDAVAAELGDLLFVAVNVARLLEVDPESALKAANRRFRRRFRHVEKGLGAQGRKPADATLEEMDALWRQAKEAERRGAKS